MVVGFYEVNVRLGWQCSQKDRRQVAQKTRDQLKHHFNASVRLVYHDQVQTFSVYLAMIAENVDDLYRLGRVIEDRMEYNIGADYEVSFDCQEW